MKNLMVLFLILPVLLSAQHDYSDDDNSLSHNSHNHISAFMGATSGIYDGGKTGFTISLEYEYMMLSSTPVFGVGAFFEAVFLDETEFIVGLPVFVHPYMGFKFYVSPSMIFRGEHKVEHNDEGIVDDNLIKSSEKFFIRLGAGYDFHFDNFAITPLINVDLIESNTYLVYGIGFGFSF